VPALAATGPVPGGVRGATFTLWDTPVTTPLVGVHGIYNALAAATAARVLGIRDAATVAALRTAAPMPGRSEWIAHQGRRVFLGLVKNPAGFEAMAGALAAVPRPRHLLLLLNDRRADGGDTSWIWDLDVDGFAGDRIRVGGSRAEALALRLKYAGVALAAPVVRDHAAAFEAAVRATPPGGALHVLLNYSAMLDLFGRLGKGLVPA
jgi:UDP-N-acetylmuramyl tripeptide synthase